MEEGHIITEKNRYHSGEGCPVPVPRQVGAGMGWMSHPAPKEMSLKKMPVHRGSSGSKASGHRRTKEGGCHFAIPAHLGDKGRTKGYFPQLGVVIGDNSICLRGFCAFS